MVDQLDRSCQRSKYWFWRCWKW